MRTVLGTREYGDILGRHGYREVTGIPSLEKALARSIGILRDFSSEADLARPRSLTPPREFRVRKDIAGAALTPESEAEPRPGGCGFNRMEETLNVRQ